MDAPDGAGAGLGENTVALRRRSSTGSYRMRSVIVLTVAAVIAAGQADGQSASPRRLQVIRVDPPPSDPAVPSSAPAQTTADLPTENASAIPRRTMVAETDPPATATQATTPPAVSAAAVPLPPTIAVETDPPGTADESVSRTIPDTPPESVPAAPAPPWEESTHTTPAGYVATDVGCPGTSPEALDAFFADRVGPAMGMDYQHVYPLGEGRYLWLFQDMFIDHSGAATSLGQSSFAHNAAMVQDGGCFTLFHRGSVRKPSSFEPGTGESVLSHWFWPMGGELVSGQLQVFWVEMVADGNNPGPGDGLPWHPAQTWIATYDPGSLRRVGFAPAPDAGVAPIYGYAVASDDVYTYLFGNSFEQNLEREGGYWNGPHSATRVFLARVPRGQLGSDPEYRTADGWSSDAAAAEPISSRYWVENPMQPRYLAGQWVSATKVDGYWGEELVIDVAADPWGPWTTVDHRFLAPRGGDPLMNTYHAHVLPWLAGDRVPICVSQNARHMERDAWRHPQRYRLACFPTALVAPPPPPTTTTSTTTTTTSSTTSTTSTTTTTTEPISTTSSTTSTTSSATSTTSTTSTSTSTSTSTTTSSTTSTTLETVPTT